MVHNWLPSRCSFALVQGVIRGNSGNTLDLGTYGTTTLDEVRQII
ncbi:hypothetical protein ACP0HM_02390 [Escherichia coli]